MVASEERSTVPFVYKWLVNHCILIKVINCTKYELVKFSYFNLKPFHLSPGDTIWLQEI